VIDPKDERQQALFKVPARRVCAILQELKVLHDRARLGEDVALPALTLHLKSGHCLTGWLLDLEEDRQEEMLLFQVVTGERNDRADDIAYLAITAIEILTVHNAADYAHHLSGGVLSQPPGKKAPSRLELKRKAQEWSDTVSRELGKTITYSILWETLKDDDIAALCLVDTMSESTGILMELMKDSFSKILLGKAVECLLFQCEDEPRAGLKEGILTIACAPGSEQEKKLSREGLKNLIEQVL
jgi:hypothetical protein